jgi:hypothetical protein
MRKASPIRKSSASPRHRQVGTVEQGRVRLRQQQPEQAKGKQGGRHDLSGGGPQFPPEGQGIACGGQAWQVMGLHQAGGDGGNPLAAAPDRLDGAGGFPGRGLANALSGQGRCQRAENADRKAGINEGPQCVLGFAPGQPSTSPLQDQQGNYKPRRCLCRQQCFQLAAPAASASAASGKTSTRPASSMARPGWPRPSSQKDSRPGATVSQPAIRAGSASQARAGGSTGSRP